jgi:hypothetical protein
MRFVLGALPAALAVVGVTVASGAQPRPPERVVQNPCRAAGASSLRCPNLRMKRPFDLYADRLTRRGRVLLRAGNSLDSVGAGPVEIHGVRDSARGMRTRQRIYRRAGGRISIRTGARLRYVPGHEGKHFWKLHHAAGFELWRLDRRGRRTKLVRHGAKVDYCLRDLRRSHPGLRRSPRRLFYPACSTNLGRRQVTLGTSVGWSDIYPATYRAQWIDVTGLRGCFAYVERADPDNRIWESNEHDNVGIVVIRLPYRHGREGCRGRSVGEVNREYGPY